jgi:hypothetical protein
MAQRCVNLAASNRGSVELLQELQAFHLPFETRKFMFSAAELLGGASGCIESAFSETCGFRQDGL